MYNRAKKLRAVAGPAPLKPEVQTSLRGRFYLGRCLNETLSRYVAISRLYYDISVLYRNTVSPRNSDTRRRAAISIEIRPMFKRDAKSLCRYFAECGSFSRNSCPYAVSPRPAGRRRPVYPRHHPSPRARRSPSPRRLPWICRLACCCPQIHPRPQGAAAEAAGAGAAAAPGPRPRLRLRTRRPPLPRPDPVSAPLGRGRGRILCKRRARRLIRGRRRRLLRPRL